MKYRAIVSLLIASVPTILLCAEPSAFGAGDLSNPKPYGLTSGEKVILETKNQLKKVALKSNSQASRLDSLRERIDGLQSIVEGIGRKTHNNRVHLQELKENQTKSLANIAEYEKRLSDSIEANKQALEEVQTTLSDISQNYVSKEQYNELVKSVNDFKKLVAKELKIGKGTHKSSKISTAKLYNQAKAYYSKRYYSKAIDAYEELIRRNYKPAYGNYMIGEMNFKRKNYANAIAYYKKSSALYSKATYMPTLMLHTAVAMQRTGDKSHAKAFYNAIIAKYPNTPEAKKAKSALGK